MTRFPWRIRAFGVDQPCRGSNELNKGERKMMKITMALAFVLALGVSSAEARGSSGAGHASHAAAATHAVAKPLNMQCFSCKLHLGKFQSW